MNIFFRYNARKSYFKRNKLFKKNRLKNSLVFSCDFNYNNIFGNFICFNDIFYLIYIKHQKNRELRKKIGFK